MEELVSAPGFLQFVYPNRLIKSKIVSAILGILIGRTMYWIISYSYKTENYDPEEAYINKIIYEQASTIMKSNDCQILPFSSQTMEDLHKTQKNVIGSWSNLQDIPSEPKIHVVTPTYRNPKQDAELIRTYQALYPVRHAVEWYIVDEYEKGSPEHIKRLQKLLETFDKNISITLLRSMKRPANFKKKFRVLGNPRGVDARRSAIKELRSKHAEGVLFFADDDNTYDSDLFRQIQNAHSITAWPVGCMTYVGLSSPIVNQKNKVVGFHDGWIGGRHFPMDFAEFAVNLEYLHIFPKANIPYEVSFEETKFLEELKLHPEQIVPLGDGATMVLAYHTRTHVPCNESTAQFSFDHKELSTSNLPELWRNLYSRS